MINTPGGADFLTRAPLCEAGFEVHYTDRQIEINANLWGSSAVLVMPMLDMPYDGRYRHRCAHCCARHRCARCCARPRCARCCARPRHARHYTLSYVLVAIPSILVYCRVSSCIVVYRGV